jgi:hypothetical protein
MVKSETKETGPGKSHNHAMSSFSTDDDASHQEEGEHPSISRKERMVNNT